MADEDLNMVDFVKTQSKESLLNALDRLKKQNQVWSSGCGKNIMLEITIEDELKARGVQ
jgi:hypothetical protein